MRTKFPVQPVNIKTDIYILRQVADDLFHDLLPCLAFVLPVFDVAVKIADYAAITIPDIVKLIAAQVTDACLYKFADLRNFIKCIVHNTGMRIIETLIGFPQVAVSINLKNTKVRILFGYRFIKTQG